MKTILSLITRNGYTLFTVVFLAFASGAWVTVKFYKAEELSKLEKAVTELQERNQSLQTAAKEYEKRKAERNVDKVEYIEKPVYLECRPDAEWVRGINEKIKADNAGKLGR